MGAPSNQSAHSHRGRWFLLALAVIAILAVLGIYLKRGPSTPVATTFQGYTNVANRQFELLSYVKRQRGPIQWRGVWVEQEGSPDHHAPIVNTNLPWVTSGESLTLAIGKPMEPVRWRVCSDYSLVGSANRYTARSRWFDP